MGQALFEAAEGGAGWISNSQQDTERRLTLGSDCSAPAAAVGQNERDRIRCVSGNREGELVRTGWGNGQVEDGLRTNLGRARIAFRVAPLPSACIATQLTGRRSIETGGFAPGLKSALKRFPASSQSQNNHTAGNCLTDVVLDAWGLQTFEHVHEEMVLLRRIEDRKGGLSVVKSWRASCPTITTDESDGGSSEGG